MELFELFPPTGNVTNQRLSRTKVVIDKKKKKKTHQHKNYIKTTNIPDSCLFRFSGQVIRDNRDLLFDLEMIEDQRSKPIRKRKQGERGGTHPKK